MPTGVSFTTLRLHLDNQHGLLYRASMDPLVMEIDSSRFFARNVATLLEVTDLTHAQLAELCGLPRPRITEVLSGKYGQNLKTLDLICRGFNAHFGEPLISPDRLIAEDFQIPAKIALQLA